MSKERDQGAYDVRIRYIIYLKNIRFIFYAQKCPTLLLKHYREGNCLRSKKMSGHRHLDKKLTFLLNNLLCLLKALLMDPFVGILSFSDAVGDVTFYGSDCSELSNFYIMFLWIGDINR